MTFNKFNSRSGFYKSYIPSNVKAIPNPQTRMVRAISARTRDIGFMYFEIATAIGTEIPIDKIKLMHKIRITFEEDICSQKTVKFYK